MPRSINESDALNCSTDSSMRIWWHAMEQTSRQACQRAKDINKADLPMALAIRQFNFKVVPVLGYVAQLVPPPHDIIRTELTATLRALSVAGNSMNSNIAFSLKNWLGLTQSDFLPILLRL